MRGTCGADSYPVLEARTGLSVAPRGLMSVCCVVTRGSRPWLLTVAPSGLKQSLSIGNQGLAALAIDGRPSGAQFARGPGTQEKACTSHAFCPKWLGMETGFMIIHELTRGLCPRLFTIALPGVGSGPT